MGFKTISYAPDDEYVYFISAGDAVKIGKSKGDPRKRLACLQTSNPNLLTLEYIAWSRDLSAHDLEQYFHCYCRDSRIRGEWFERDGAIRKVRDAIIHTTQGNKCSLLEMRQWGDNDKPIMAVIKKVTQL